MEQIKCFKCGKLCGHYVGVFRGTAECPECSEKALDPKHAFKAGFVFGRQEQYERDFPDVGFRFDQDVEHYWDIYEKGAR